MMPVFQATKNLKKSTILVSLVVLGSISFFGCNKTEPPAAKVEPTPVQQAVSAPPTQAPSPVASQPASPTMKNLQAAYNGESNANVMYLAFAQKADQEGYKQVASLFRAAAKAEEIHRDNHAKVIKAMGGVPQNNITTPEVKTTAENLATAIKGESYERDTMYPNFITQAKAENNPDALQTLNYAMVAEAQHAKFYTEAKDNLTAWQEQTSPFYVCNISGETFITEQEASACPATPAGQTYQSVS